MLRYDKSLRELQTEHAETYSCMTLLLEKYDWEFFSADGASEIQAYEILDDVFGLAYSLEHLACLVANEIYKMNREIQKADSEDAEEKRAVIAKLVSYITYNIDPEIWSEHPEFR